MSRHGPPDIDFVHILNLTNEDRANRLGVKLGRPALQQAERLIVIGDMNAYLMREIRPRYHLAEFLLEGFRQAEQMIYTANADAIIMNERRRLHSARVLCDKLRSGEDRGEKCLAPFRKERALPPAELLPFTEEANCYS